MILEIQGWHWKPLSALGVSPIEYEQILPIIKIDRINHMCPKNTKQNRNRNCSQSDLLSNV